MCTTPARMQKMCGNEAAVYCNAVAVPPVAKKESASSFKYYSNDSVK